MDIYLPNSAHLGNIEGFLRRLNPKDPSELRLSMHSSWVALHPLALAITACAGATVRANGGKVMGAVESVASLPYLVRMRLFDHLDLDAGISVTEHEAAGRFIPLTQIRTKEDLSQFIVDMIPLLHAEPDEVEPIQYVLSELVRNALEHAYSPVGAFVCAQYFRKTKRLAVGVADSGIGVLRSMRQSHPVTNALDAIHMALRPGITGTTSEFGGTEYNAGAGLFFTKAIACASRNFFVLYSGNGMFKLRRTPLGEGISLEADPTKDLATNHRDLPAWEGTAAGIDMSLETHSVFSELMKDIRNAYFSELDWAKRSRRKKPRFA